MADTTPTQRSAHLVTHNHGASYEHGMQVSFEGDEPEAPTPWELMLAGAEWVLLAFALVCTLLAAAGYFFNH